MSDNPIIDGLVSSALINGVATNLQLGETAAKAITDASNADIRARQAGRETADANRQLEMANKEIADLRETIEELQGQVRDLNSDKRVDSALDKISDQGNAYNLIINQLKVEIESIKKGWKYGELEAKINELQKKNSEKDLRIAQLEAQVKEYMAAKDILQKIAISRRKRLGLTGAEAMKEEIAASKEVAQEKPELADTATVKKYSSQPRLE